LLTVTVKLLIQAPGFYWNKWPGPGPTACIRDPASNGDLKHCQLAILNFVCIWYTRFQIRNTTNKHVYVSLCWNSTPIGPTSARTGTMWTPACIGDLACIRSFTVHEIALFL